MGLMKSIAEVFSKTSASNWKTLLEGGAKIIDVRTPREFKSGHAKGSKNIPLDELDSRLNELKGESVVLVCRSGARAQRARKILMNNGIQAENAGAWQNI